MAYFDVRSDKWVLLRDTAEYKQRCRMLRDGWLVVTPIMISLPLPWSIIVVLAATFLSFMFLDETEYAFMDTDKPQQM